MTERLPRSGARRARPRFLRRSALALLLVAAAARPGFAAPLEAIAGWEGDSFRQGYGFGTLGVLLRGDARLAFPVRLTASYLYYEFEDAGASTRVRAPGAGGLLGTRLTLAHATITLAGGGELRWERRAAGPGGAFGGRVARGGAVVEGTADLRVGRRLRPFLLGTYAGSARYVFARSALRWQCSNLDWSGPATWNAGIEATAQGNADTDALQVGGLVELALTRARLSLGLHGGYKSSDPGGARRRNGGYGGLSLYRRF